MDQSKRDTCIITALIIRMDEFGIPRAKHLLDKVSSGEILSERDIMFLKRVYRDNRINQALIRSDPEFQRIMARFIDLYTEIITLAMENERSRITTNR